MDDLKKLAEKIGALDDDRLAEAIRGAGAALGLDDRITGRLARDPAAIRRKINGAGERDLERVRALLTPERLAALKRAVEGADNGGR